MRLIVTADLHYDIARSIEPTRRVADDICRTDADALLILGDAAGRDTGILCECLQLFDSFRGRRFFVAGNHDIWTEPGGDSLKRLDETIPAICREAGFHPLDREPAVIGDVGLVGSIGWYDLGLRPSRLGVPLRFYQSKVAPGAATRLARYEHLVTDLSDVPEEMLRVGCRWMDGEHVRLPMSDIDFCHLLLERLTHQIEQIAPDVRTIVAGTHHLPFRELVPDVEDLSRAFAGAYMGSELFGELLLQYPKIRHAFCGHSHSPGRVRHGHLACVNVGCTYLAKRFEVLDL